VIVPLLFIPHREHKTMERYEWTNGLTIGQNSFL